MAWLKFDVATPEKPEVLQITVAMGWDDPDLTVGKLLKLWRWFDQHTTDGNASGVTTSLLDRLIGVTGFAKAVSDAGWLVIHDEGLTLPNFGRHNGKTAKDRVLTAQRVASHKASKKGNGASVTSALPREEKRREEVNPSAQPPGFAEFWKTYPRKVGKAAAEKAWSKAKGVDLSTILQAIERARATEQWLKDGGQFIPHPSTWLAQRRWEDEPAEAAPMHSTFAGVV